MSMTVQPQPDRPEPTVIAAQNDAFRKLACLGVPPAQPIQGRMNVTRALMEAGDGFMAEAVKATGEFATFAKRIECFKDVDFVGPRASQTTALAHAHSWPQTNTSCDNLTIVDYFSAGTTKTGEQLNSMP